VSADARDTRQGAEFGQPLVDLYGHRLVGLGPVVFSTPSTAKNGVPFRAAPSPSSQARNARASSVGCPLYDDATMMVASASGCPPTESSSGATVVLHPRSVASSASSLANARQVPRFEPCSTASVIPVLTRVAVRDGI
jgi:hypothetical protein